MNCCDEYCASHGCNQGRNCPARGPAKVAKVKSSKPRYASTPSQAQCTARIRILAKWMLRVLAILFIFAIVAAIAPRSKSMRVPCDLAEISPDLTPQQRELCRGMRRLSV